MRNRQYEATTGAIDTNEKYTPTTWTRLDEKTGNNTRNGQNHHKHQLLEHAREQRTCPVTGFSVVLN